VSGILGRGIDEPAASRAYPTVTVELGETVIHRGTRFRGTLIAYIGDGVVLQGASGDERQFRSIAGAFLVRGAAVTIDVRAGLRRAAQARAAREPAPSNQTASGSIALANVRARTARAGRIWVEGIHDAELVERVWGDDLRIEGVVVERLDGIDGLVDAVGEFAPAADARLGILVDHLVPGSKEQRITARVTGPHVLVTGTPYVDVWQAIRPKTLGITAWPTIPRGEDWKTGVCQRLGLDPARAWPTLKARVRSYADLEPSFVGAVESLIDFVLDASDDA
jgi:hypothetical protein